MKTNTKNIAPKWHLKFSLFCLLFLMTIMVKAQKLEKTYSMEIPVSAQVEISSKGPCSMGFNMNGRISTSTLGNKYTIVPGANDGLAALTVKDYQVFTWDQNKVKQVVGIEVVPDESAPAEAQKLLDHLKITLKESPANTIAIDDNMNLARFGFSNGWFSSNKSFVITDDGQEFRIKSITIQSKIYIPKQSTLNIEAENVPIAIGDMTGKLMLNVRATNLQVGEVENLEASLLFTEAKFKSIAAAKINGINSTVNTGCVGQLLIGSNEWPNRSTSRVDLFDQNYGLSYSTKYMIEGVEEMKIVQSTLDKFSIGKVGIFESTRSKFTDYQIDELTEKLFLNAQNGDLEISSVEESFDELVLENNISSIYLGMQANPDYQIKLFSNEYTEYTLPENLLKEKGESKWEEVYYKGDKTQGGTIEIRCSDCRVIVRE